jgi:hypothetical protein
MRKQLENLRQFFIRKPKPSKRAPVPPKKYIKRAYQPVADRELQRMVFLRFGNIQGTGVPIRSYNHIAIIMRKWPMTVHSALRRWYQHGQKTYDGRVNNGQHMKKKSVLQGPLKDYLLSKETLDKWSGHCL